MSLHVEMRVNGEIIGTIEARRYLSQEGREHPIYGTEVREVSKTGTVTGRRAIVEHDPEDGAWVLVQKILDQHPKRSWE